MKNKIKLEIFIYYLSIFYIYRVLFFNNTKKNIQQQNNTRKKENFYLPSSPVYHKNQINYRGLHDLIKKMENEN